ncbi:DivIVA domain-containing protein [Bifidobacterium apri]|uniref:Cell wall synthesis protein Wag31 n=1 Tax=Bifidobacterium apri TaxID=1769423 RepID=A0A6A2WBV8_9BIFI|nr:DivIVA domain-containing protein [Bifidobacterium apri]KAB8291887.1 cell division protein DivIVA [Bifidobacterium apri]
MNSPLLTPEDVRRTTFHTHRLREGYDTDEVDEFMDKAKDTIRRLASQVQALQTDIAKYKAITGQYTIRHEWSWK